MTDWLTDLIYLDYIQEDEWIKNKNSGAVYQVKERNPKKHDKPTPEEIKASKKDTTDLKGVDLGGFGDTPEGKEIIGGLINFTKTSYVSTTQKKHLEKHVKFTINDDGTRTYKVFNKGKEVGEIPAKLFAKIEKRTKNESPEFVKLFESATGSNAGLNAEEAATETLAKFQKDPKKMPIPWQQQFKQTGLDFDSPYEVEQLGASQVVVLDPETGEPAGKVSSKTDIIIRQNGKTVRLSMKYAGARPASLGEWPIEKLQKHFKDNPDYKPVDDAQTKIRELRGVKSPSDEQIEELDNARAVVGEFYRGESGKRFLVEIMTERVPSGLLQEEDSKAEYMMVVDSKGGLQMHKPEEYIDTLQAMGVGTGGCGVFLDFGSESRGHKIMQKTRQSVETLDFIEA